MPALRAHLHPSLAGHYLRGSAEPPEASAPEIDGLPTISGTARVNETLTASPASVTGYPAPTNGWQWFRDGSAISGAESATYTLVSADLGADMSVDQIPTNSEGSASATSATVGPVAAAFAAPVATGAPSWSDATPAPGDTVTITEGTYSGNPAPTIAGTLTLASVDVTDDMAGSTYTIPGGTTLGASLVWSETATNSEGSATAQTATATVTDTVAPGLSDFTATDQDGNGDVAFDLADLSEDATAFFVVVPANSTAPSKPEIVAGEASGGGAPADSGSFSATTGGGPYTETMATGIAAGDYDVYLVLRDADMNLSPVYVAEDVAMDTAAPAISFADAIAGGDDPVSSNDYRYARTTGTLYGQSFITSGQVQSIDTLATLPGSTMTNATRNALEAAGSFVAVYDTTNTGAATALEARNNSSLNVYVLRNSGNDAVTSSGSPDAHGAVDVSALYGQSAGTVYRLYIAWTQPATSRVFVQFNRFTQAGDRYRRCTIFSRDTFDADDATMETEIAGMAI